MSTGAGLVLAVVVAGLCAAVTMTAAALRARQLGVVAVVDVAWGLGFVLVAVVSAAVGSLVDGADARRWLVALPVAAWGLRLAWHVRSRAAAGGGHEDPRYEQLLGGPLREVGMASAVRRVFAVQGLAQWFVALPVAVGAVLGTDWWWVAAVGVAVWAVGLVFEAVGDQQLRRFRARPREERPSVMDQGLWGWTRHPNYFGDACVWWGIWLVAASAWPGVLTVLSPVVMTYFLLLATGARLLEQTMMKRPGYPEYAARTSMFVPLPPRRQL